VAHECRHDGLPCFGLSACYGHLKAAALNGGRDRLSDEERAFVGVGTGPLTTPGWRSPTGLYLDEFDGEVDPVLKALAMLGQSGLEFLG
jgi:hypothetical protein